MGVRLHFRKMKKVLVILLILGTSFVFYPATGFAWDIRAGFQYLMPKLGPHEQEYESEEGQKARFTPEIDETIVGQGLGLGVGFGAYSVILEGSEFDYQLRIPEDEQIQMGGAKAIGAIAERRLGIYYHLERDLAGLLVGFGVTEERETLSTEMTQWSYETITPFGAFGIDIIFGGLRLRLQQTHYGIGNHTVKVNSLGAWLVF